MTIDERQAWLLFIGLIAASMGVSLFCEAEVQAESLGEWPGADLRRLVRAYRAAGAAFAAGGAALAAAALTAPQRVLGSFRLFAFNDSGRLAGGVILILVGTTWAAARWTRRPRPLSASLEGEALLSAFSPTLRARAASAAGWARVGLTTLYGCFLLSRIGGLPQ